MSYARHVSATGSRDDISTQRDSRRTSLSSCSTTSLDRLLPDKQDPRMDSTEPMVDSHVSSELGSKANGVVVETTLKSKRHEPPPYVKSLSKEEREVVEKALVRKIDIRLIPPIIIMYILNYLDRNNIASARLAGLEADLNLQGTQYQTCVSILFVGYLLMQIPSNIFLSKIDKPSLYLPTCMIVWGTMSALTAAVKDFGGLLAVRFFLGFVEAPYFPGCLYFLSTWYTRKELAFRTAMLYSGSLISGAFSGLIAAGITNGLDGARGISAWRWLFIIEGSTTIFLACCAIFVLPDFPRTTTWLTPEEKELAIWRLDEDIGEADLGSNEEKGFSHGFVLACKDIKMWILMVMIYCISFSGSITSFFPTVVETLGYGPIVSLLLTAPPYILCVLTAFANAWHADRGGERYFHVTLPLYIAVIAFIIAAATTATGPRYLSMMLMVPGIYTGLVVAFGWISNTMPRPPAKRAAALAFINAVSNTSTIFVSLMFAPSMAPRYVLAMSLCCCTAFIAILAATTLRIVLIRLNRKLDMGKFVDGAVNADADVPGEAAKHGFRFLI